MTTRRQLPLTAGFYRPLERWDYGVKTLLSLMFSGFVPRVIHRLGTTKTLLAVGASRVLGDTRI